MARRYKEKKKRKTLGHRYITSQNKEIDSKNINSKNKRGILIFSIILIIILITIIGINRKWLNFNINNEEKEITEKEADKIVKEISNKVEQQNILLEGNNLLNLKELTNEISSKLDMGSKGDVQIVQIHYKLKSLDVGMIEVYYKINDIDLIKINVNINEKKIENMENIESDSLLQREGIGDNLNENVQEDFESRKESLDVENKSVNIIITNTEVVINTGID